ncbi:hypothetical protein V5F59_12380 [Xanthobacter autotrophicus DSM 431]|uniref:hypothetical protein n=1 Tax=Xanthobacter nonsaccharivorans TaxID=3119912 RepID=UPI003727FF00
MQIEMQQKLAGRLLPGERLLWAGRPRRGLMFVGSDVPVTLFFLAWTGIPLAGVVSEGLGKGHWAFSIFALPFLAVGFYMLFLRYLHDAWLRARTFYAVTDRRLLIWREGPWSSFRSYDRAGLNEMELLENGARGTIRFGRTAIGGRHQVSDSRPAFLGIEDARGVFDLLQRTRPAAFPSDQIRI